MANDHKIEDANEEGSEAASEESVDCLDMDRIVEMDGDEDEI